MSSLSMLIALPTPPKCRPTRIIREGQECPPPPEPRPPLEARCNEVLAIMRAYRDPLTVFELRARMPIKSIAYVRRLLNNLLDEKKIRVDKVGPRGVLFYSVV